MFKLVIQDDEGKTTVVPLIRDEITIGRKEGNTIRLTERNVSRRHARILRSNNEVQIEDLGSYNGIRVNNARIAERVSLRISDQVQIGDYKLYLKAEGAEQVDDARTMPIERIDNVAPTAEMAAIQNGSPAAIPGTPNPAARSLGVQDTDPAGRPVATNAQVAALNTSVGYGKLVVLSSNFAGKEFELSRPQMIVGRTDENDLVINHRSISRNHAKLTRDTETQRYTISDLQSSNGVRVNGQDYGKVELRRGDVVDLGHVRFRFVEPGEDFVFARDGKIADVEGTGAKKGIVIAIILAVVLIGAVGAFFAMKSGGGGGGKAGSNDVGSNLGSNDQIVGSANNNGSGGSAVVAMAPVDAADTVVPTNDPNKQFEAECDADLGSGHWDNVKMCADKLKTSDPAKSKEYAAKALAETGFDGKHAAEKQAIADGNLAKAKKLLGEIPETSFYRKAAQDDYDAAEDKMVEDYKAKAQKYQAANKCKDLDQLITQIAPQSARAADAMRAYKCQTVAVAPPPPEDCTTALKSDSKECKKQFCAGHADNARCVSATVAPPSCNAEALTDQGTAAEGRGEHAGALASFEASYRCKKDSHVVQLSFMAACNANKADSARRWWKLLSPDIQSHLLQICLKSHITKDILDGP